MRLIDVKELHPPFDCASGMAEGLLATGNFKVYTPPEKPNKPKPKQDIVWNVIEGAVIEGVWDPPGIVYRCNTCANSGRMTGPTVHKTQTARCCGTSSKVPDHVADQYVALRKKWEPKHKRYVEAVRKNEEVREQQRQAAIREENRRLAFQLRLEGTSQS